MTLYQVTENWIAEMSRKYGGLGPDEEERAHLHALAERATAWQRKIDAEIVRKVGSHMRAEYLPAAERLAEAIEEQESRKAED